MNKKEFYIYISTPDSLTKSSLAEINALVNEYPYCQTAHLLLLQNLHEIEDIEFENRLKTSALCIADRKKLFYLIKDKHVEAKPTAKQIIETPDAPIRPVAQIKDSLPKKESGKETAKQEKAEIVKTITVNKETPKTQITQEKPKQEESAKTKKKKLEPVTSDTKTVEEQPKQKPTSIADLILKKYANLKGQSDNAKEQLKEKPQKETDVKQQQSITPVNDKEHIQEDKKTEKAVVPETTKEDKKEINPKEKTVISDDEKHSFSEWLNILKKESVKEDVQNVNIEDDLISRFIQKSPMMPKASESTNLQINLTEGEENLTDNLFSETLAKIYLNQNHFEQAIKIYQKLMLHYPEKSSYFATQIEDIKSNLK